MESTRQSHTFQCFWSARSNCRGLEEGRSQRNCLYRAHGNRLADLLRVKISRIATMDVRLGEALSRPIESLDSKFGVKINMFRAEGCLKKYTAQIRITRYDGTTNLQHLQKRKL